MAGWHHGLNGHEFEQAPGVGDGQESLVYCSPRDRKELDVTEQLNRTEHVSGGSVVKNTSANSGDMSFITGSRSYPGGRNGNPLQYSCLENSHEQKSLAGYSLWGRKESDITE